MPFYICLMKMDSKHELLKNKSSLIQLRAVLDANPPGYECDFCDLCGVYYQKVKRHTQNCKGPKEFITP